MPNPLTRRTADVPGPPSRVRRGARRRAGIAAAALAAVLLGAGAAALTVGSANAAVGAGTYTLVNAGSGLCLTLPGASTSSGVQLDQTACNGSGSQSWTLTSASTGFTIKSASSGLCAGVIGAATNAGKAVEQETCSGATSQEWTLTASGSDYRVVNVNSGECVNTSGNATTPGALIVQNGCDSVVTKQWAVNPASGSPGPSPSPTPTTPSPAPTPTSTSTPPPPSGMQGFATVSGDGHGATTGGAGGPTVTVTSLSALESAAASSGPQTIMVNGLFSGSGEVTVASNKTIIGVGANSGLTGIGLSMQGKSGANVYNVIIRNMNISYVTAASGDGDAIHIQYADHIWVDHNNLFSDMTHGKDYYDGLVDITHASDYVSVSWNYIHDHYKVSLVGDSDNNGAEDTGHLHVTYYDNYFQNFDSRTPSLRFGTGHVFNNYFVNGSTGVDSREGAQMLVQNNVFVNVGTPIETCCESAVDGFVNQSGNDFGTGTNDITQTGTFTSPPYSYTLISTSQVASTVTAGAGTGKIGA
jgi:pectate lyase